ncbi:MAG: glycerol-3-phosphate dehydrogenase subunit GlpB [Acidimicrobiia bacterium]|nr:glycerol-3-phosphate dehydrogenase subunit GlpB [Acidimicrobiia bacterium]
MSGRVVVVGGGPAGLLAGLAASRHGARVRVLARGWGVFHWHAGCVDVLGYQQGDGTPVASPRQAVAALVAATPDHPYALVGTDGVAEVLTELSRLCAAAGYPLVGSFDSNQLMPTAVGGARPTCLAPATMTAGELGRGDAALIVGFDRFPDLAPGLVAANLEQRGIPSRPVTLDLAALRRRRFVTGPVLAALFETEEFRAEVAAALGPKVGRAGRIGFPAVLGLDRASEVVADLRHRLGAEVFEIPVVPPSIPGLRLHRILTAAIRTAGGRVSDGMAAVGAETTGHETSGTTTSGDDGHGQRVTAVLTEAAARTRRNAADAFVLATGGILGGGIVGEEDGRLTEVVFGLPVSGPHQRDDWLRADFADPAGHPVYRSGLVVDAELRPIGGDGAAVYGNLHAAGGAIAGADAIRERSVDGIALATGHRAGVLAARSALDRSEGAAAS